MTPRLWGATGQARDTRKVTMRLHRTACTESGGALPSPPAAVSSSGMARALRCDRGRMDGHPAPAAGHRVGDTRTDAAGIATRGTFPCQSVAPSAAPRVEPHPPIQRRRLLRISSPRCPERQRWSAQRAGVHPRRSTAGRTAPTRATLTRSSRNRVWAHLTASNLPSGQLRMAHGAGRTSTMMATTHLAVLRAGHHRPREVVSRRGRGALRLDPRAHRKHGAGVHRVTLGPGRHAAAERLLRSGSGVPAISTATALATWRSTPAGGGRARRHATVLCVRVCSARLGGLVARVGLAAVPLRAS